MTLTMANFGSALEVVTYVNDNSILQANMEKIEYRDGRWFLFYWV